MTDKIEIRVNGRLFTDWEHVTLDRSIDFNAGSFTFSSSSRAPFDYPVRAGDAVNVVINDTSMVTGFVDSLSGAGSKDQGNSISVSGRDNTQDLIDSSMPDAVKSIEGPITLQSLCEVVIASLNAPIKVSSNLVVAGFDEFQNFAADSGRKCMDFLVSFARKRQVYLVADGNGNLVLFRPELRKSSTAILNERDNRNNNVISYNVSLNHQNRFNQYVVRSQDNFGFDEEADYKGEGVNRTGIATDNEIRTSRFLELQAPETENDEEAQQTSIELANIRTTNSQTYTCSIPGFTQEDGTVWNFGQLADVRDDFAGVKGVFMIKAVKYSKDLNSGSIATLTLVPPEAYQVRETDSSDRRVCIRSDTLQLTVPATLKFPRF